MTAAVQGQLILLTRDDCTLCDEFLQDLGGAPASLVLPPVAVVDVDSDTTWQRRFGHRIPVLLWDGLPICEARLDIAELERLFRRRQPV